eukprot:m.130992 g.130992  ORF g.130992 m.130992 type:complete len:909 (-) comp13065_c5_seq1:70-2796(-)
MSYRSSAENDFHESARRNHRARQSNGRRKEKMTYNGSATATTNGYHHRRNNTNNDDAYGDGGRKEAQYSRRRADSHLTQSALRQCEELTQSMQHQMTAADETVRAIRAAQDALDTQLAMKTAKAEAEAWTHGKSKLASLKAAQNLSPLGVRAVIAERDELRYQLRKASQVLKKVESTTQIGHDLGSVFQQDIDQLSAIKSSIELEQHTLMSRLAVLESKVEGDSASRRQDSLQISTLEEQLAEKDEIILTIENELHTLRGDFKAFKKESEERLRNELNSQRKRLKVQGDDIRSSSLQQLESAMRQEKMNELEDQRRDLQQHYEQLIDRKLSEQHHVLSSQLNADKVDELKRLQEDMQNHHNDNTQQMRRQLISEKEQVVRDLRRQHNAVVGRLEGEIQSQHQQLRAEKNRELDEQKKSFLKEMANEVSTAVKVQTAQLEKEHKAEIREMRQRLEDVLQQQAKTTMEKELSLQRKKLLGQHKREQQVALNNLQKELEDKHRLAIKDARSNITNRKDEQHRRALEKEVERKQKAKADELSRQHKKKIEKLQTKHKQDKQAALDQLEERLTSKHDAEIKKLREELTPKAMEAREALRTRRIDQGESLHAEQSARRSLSSLKNKLRTLLQSLKKYTVTSAEASSDGTTSAATDSITRFIACLNTNNFSSLGDISLEASNAPLHTIDVLFTSVEELVAVIESTQHELLSTQQSMGNERKRLKKQVESELQGEHSKDMENLRFELNRQFDFELEHRIQATRQHYSSQLSQFQKDAQSRMKAYEELTAAQQKHVVQALKEQQENERDAMVTRLTGHINANRRDDGEREALERQLISIDRELKDTKVSLESVMDENSELRQRVHELRFGMTSGTNIVATTTAAANFCDIAILWKVKKICKLHTPFKIHGLWFISSI